MVHTLSPPSASGGRVHAELSHTKTQIWRESTLPAAGWGRVRLHCTTRIDRYCRCNRTPALFPQGKKKLFSLFRLNGRKTKAAGEVRCCLVSACVPEFYRTPRFFVLFCASRWLCLDFAGLRPHGKCIFYIRIPLTWSDMNSKFISWLSLAWNRGLFNISWIV